MRYSDIATEEPDMDRRAFISSAALGLALGGRARAQGQSATALVIGAGFAGLGAARTLADAGVSVIVSLMTKLLAAEPETRARAISAPLAYRI